MSIGRFLATVMTSSMLGLAACGGGGGGSSPPDVIAASITLQPQPASVEVGGAATFQVTASGTGPISYQWRANSTAIAGATEATYTLSGLTLADNGRSFDVVVSNAAGSVTSAAALLTVSLAERTQEIASTPLSRLQVDLNAAFRETGLQPSESYEVSQVSGPTLATSLAGSFLNMVGPADTGVDTSATVEAVGSVGKLRLIVNFASTRQVTTNDFGDADDDGAARVVLTGTADPVGTEGPAKDVIEDLASFGFVVANGPVPEEVSVHVATRSDGRNITDYFAFDPDTGKAQVTPESVAQLRSFVGAASGLTFTITGKNLHTVVSTIHAPSRIRGRLVDSSGNALSSLQGRRLVLEGGLSGFSDEAIVAADGTFTFPTVPVESFNLELRDPDNAYLAQGSPVIDAVNQELVLDLLVTDLKNGIGAQGSQKRALGVGPSRGAVPFKAMRERSRTGARTERPPRRAITQAAPLSANPPTCEPTSGTFTVSAAQENVTMTCQGTHTIAKGATQVKVKINVTTEEFPGYSPVPGNPYNDRWAFNVQMGSGQLFAKNARVNNSHSTRGSIDLVDECVDVSTLAEDTDLVATISLQSTNIGDSALTTIVTASFSECSGLQAKEFKMSRTSPNTSGLLFLNNKALNGEIRYFLSMPKAVGGYTTFRFPAEIRFSPAEAQITGVKLEIESAGGGQVLAENALDVANGYGLAPGKVSFSQLSIPPSAQILTGIATVRATLTATLDGVSITSDPIGAQVSGDSNKATNFALLYEAGQRLGLPASRRYSGREENLGLDAWAIESLLDSITAVDWVFNDITAQHTARAGSDSLLQHKGHGNGREVDARYWDDAGAQGNTPMNGNATGGTNAIHALIQDVCAPGRINSDGTLKTGQQDNPQHQKLVDWTTHNRVQLGSVMARGDVLLIHVPEIGSLIHSALVKGLCPGSTTAKIMPTSWSPGVNKLSPSPPHNDHWHVTFKQ